MGNWKTSGKVVHLCLGMFFLLWRTNAASANLVVNGGFENYIITGLPYDALDKSGLFVRFYGPPNTSDNTDITGWTVAGTTGGNPNNLDLVFSGYWPAFAGNDSLDMSGATGAAGVIEQSVPTVPGQQYNLSFEYGDNPGGSGASMGISATGNGVLLSDNVTHNSSDYVDMNYQLYSSNFVANSIATTIQFTSATNSGYGIVVDAVSVVPVPEPASFALLVFPAAQLARPRRT
jgi:hypothetical protein